MSLYMSTFRVAHFSQTLKCCATMSLRSMDKPNPDARNGSYGIT